MKKCAAVSYILHLSFLYLACEQEYKGRLKVCLLYKSRMAMDRAKNMKQHVQLIHDQWDQIFSNSTCDEHLEEDFFRVFRFVFPEL